jgi:hypothetical protein
MPAFELIGQQSFGTVVFFHHKAPERVKKLMGKRLAFPKHHKAYQVATLFGTWRIQVTSVAGGGG